MPNRRGEIPAMTRRLPNSPKLILQMQVSILPALRNVLTDDNQRARFSKIRFQPSEDDSHTELALKSKEASKSWCVIKRFALNWVND